MVEIRNKEQLDAVLYGKRVEWHHVIAMRTALRVLPLWKAPNQRPDLTLKIFRALFFSWGAVEWPSREMRAAAAAVAREGAVAVRETVVLDFASPFVAAAAYAAAATTASPRDATATHAALAAAAAIKADTIWVEIEDDVQALEGAEDDFQVVRNLAKTPLWSGGRPFPTIAERWNVMKAHLADQVGEFWQPWIEWYERILAGEEFPFSGLTRYANERFCLELARESHEFWHRDFAIVNADIAERLNLLRSLGVPPQAPGPLITYERDGRVARQMPSAPDDPKGALHSAREALIDSIDDFEAAFPSHNHSGLRQALVRLRAALGADYQHFDVIRAGAAAERIHRFALKADEIFLPEMAVEVVALNVNVGRTLGNSADWGEFCRGLDDDADPLGTDIEAVKEVSQELVKTDALEDQVKEELNYEVLAADWEDGGSRERKILMRGVMNVLATMSKIALDYAKLVQGAAGEGHKEGIKDITKAATVGAFTALSASLLSLAGQSPMFAFLVPVLTYLSKFASK